MAALCFRRQLDGLC